MQLPILSNPIRGEQLWVYLKTPKAVVNSLLIHQEGAEHRLEKLTFVLALRTRHLWSYFLSHPIVVLTDISLGHILRHPEAMGRLIKWVIEFIKYDIKYQPRQTIKASLLVSFILEAAHSKETESWLVFVDGSSNSEGSRVGVVLISTQGDEIKLVVQLYF